MVTHSHHAAVYFWEKQTSTMDRRSDRDLEMGEQVFNYLAFRIMEMDQYILLRNEK